MTDSTMSALYKMPLYYEMRVNGRSCAVVHGEYAESLEDIAKAGYSSLEEFYLQAREEAYLLGGKSHGMVNSKRWHLYENFGFKVIIPLS